MAHAGKTIASPTTTIVFKATSTETNGELLRFEQFGRPGVPPVQEHVHPGQEERFVVLSGQMGVRVSGRERVVPAGGEVTVPAGVPHTWWNASQSGEVLHQLIELRPALDSETFFETLLGLERDGKLPSGRGPAALLRMAPVLRRGELFLPGVPIVLQRLLFGALSLLAWPLGYRGRYPRYSDRPERRK